MPKAFPQEFRGDVVTVARKGQAWVAQVAAASGSPVRCRLLRREPTGAVQERQRILGGWVRGDAGHTSVGIAFLPVVLGSPSPGVDLSGYSAGVLGP